MATQTITTRFKTEGANKVAKETEQVGRAQTRLGQASASAGRQFAAQATGLGGLVAAYAGAAATIFAITAAFTALNRAARAEQTITGVNALSNAIGESGPKIIKGLQEITKGQLSIVQTAELANLALSSGFSADQINNLAEISLKASRALGRDLTDSFNRLVRGVTKLEPELLDELGIFTRLDPAVEAYAKSLGKTVGSLSNFERRQAFANAVAEEGADKFRDIDTSADTSAQSLEKLAATISNLGVTTGGFIAGALAPIADALSAPITAIGTFGILTRTVFGSTIREARNSLADFDDRVEAFGGKLIDKFGGGSKAAKTAVANLGLELDKANLRTARVSTANDAAFKSYINLGRSQQLSFRDTQNLISIINQEVATNNKKLTTLNSVENKTKAQITQIGVLERRNKELEKIGSSAQDRIDKTGKVSQKAAGALGTLGKGFGILSRGVLGVLGGLTTLITVFSLFATIGSVVLEAFGWLDPLIKGISYAVRFVRQLLGLQQELIEQGKVLRELVKPDLFTTPLTATAFQLREFEKTIDPDTLADSVRSAIAAGATNSAEEFANAVFGNLPEEFRRAGVAFKNARKLKPEFERLFRTIFQGLEGVGPEALQGVSEFAEATGRTIKTSIGNLSFVGNQIQFKGIKDAVGPLSEVTARFIDTSNLIGEARTEADKFNQSQVAILQSQEVSVNLVEALASGAANAEQIEKRRAAVLAKIDNLNKQINEKENGIFVLKGKQRAETIALVEALQETFDLTDRQAQTQLSILNEREKILKTFNAEIKAAEKLNDIFTLVQKGDTISLKILDDQNARRREQINLLLQDFELGKDQLALERSGVELQGDQAQLATLARDAQKAIVGLYVQTNEEARKLAEQLEKILQKEEARLSGLNDQIAVLKAQRAVTEAKQEIEDVNTVFENRLKQFDLEKKLADVRRNAALNVLKTEQEINMLVAEANFLTASQKRELEITFKEEQLAELRDYVKAEEANIRERVRIQQTQITTEINALADILKSSGEGTIADAFEKQRTAEVNAINSRRDIQLAEIDLLKSRNDGILEQARSFTDHINGIAEVLAADIVARKELNEGTDFVKNTQALLSEAGISLQAFGGVKSVADARRARVALEQPGAEFTADLALSDLIARLEGADFEKIKATITDAAKAEQDLADLRLNNAQADKIRETENRLAELQQKLIEVGIAGDIELGELSLTLQKSINDLNIAVSSNNLANNRLAAAYRDVAGITTNYVENGLMDLNTALIEGNLTFKSIAKGFRDMLGSMLREIQSAVFRQTIAQPIAEFVGGLFAAGGRVHLAGGGSMKRDRVAAMLEPGEYVIRKEAAKKLGMSKLQELNAGVSDDPIARIIAYAYGSKVKSKATGGGMGFGNPGEIGYGGTGIGPTGVGPSTGPSTPGGGLGSFSSGAGESVTSFAPSPNIGPTSVSQGFYSNASNSGFGSLVSTTPFGPPTVTDSIIGKLGGSTYMNTPQLTEGKLNQLNAEAEQAQQMAEEAASLISQGYTDSQISAYQTMQNIATEIGAPGDFSPEEAPGLLSEVQNNQKGGQGLQQAYNNAFKSAPQQFVESLAPKTPLQGLSLIAGTGLIGETAQAISQISGAIGFAQDVAEGENAIGQALGLGKASGGKILRMAGGGSVNSRDRVPALLEPGEFVIRRPAAKAIGGAALNQMNATGKAPSISVNMTNQGAPKDVAVGAPKINGDKIILDIITRDLRNNGSIKKTLRKGK